MAARKTPAKKKAPAKKKPAKNVAKRADDKRKQGAAHTRSDQVKLTQNELKMNRLVQKGKNDVGRPCSYTEEIGAEICIRLSEGESLNSICRDDYMPNKSTVVRWVMFGDDEYHYQDPEVREKLAIFSIHYNNARMIQAEGLIDENTDIADDSRNDFVERENQRTGEVYEVPDQEHIHRSKLRVETRKWLAEIYLPKVQALRNRNIALTGKQPLVLQFDAQDEEA